MADLVLPSSLAVWDPLGGTPEPVMTGHDGVCVHTMAGTFVGTDAYFHQNGWSGTESTVGVAGSGFCKQWVPWNRQADANLEGNARWLSIECADYGESFPPASTAGDESPPLTTAQIAKIIDLCVFWCRKSTHIACPSTWRCHQEGIPARFIRNSCERGIGTHYHGIEGRGLVGGCPRWSASGGKLCPRMVRHRQVRDVIVPEVARRLTSTPTPTQEDDDMIIEFIAEGALPRTIAGGVVFGWKTNADRAAFNTAAANAGYKIIKVAVSQAQYDALTDSFIQGQDFAKMIELLGQIGMFTGAIAQIEGREEERDLATPPA